MSADWRVRVDGLATMSVGTNASSMSRRAIASHSPVPRRFSGRSKSDTSGFFHFAFP